MAGSAQSRLSTGEWLVASVVPAIVCYVIVAIAGWYVKQFHRQTEPAGPRAALQLPTTLR